MARTLVTLLLVMAWTLPAHAGSAPAETGISQGIAAYGKNGACDQHGTAELPSGAGMGTTGWGGPKNIWMSYDGIAISSRGLSGTMALCMRLTSVLGNVIPLGAGCDVSKAYGGQGKLTWPETAESVWLTHVGWKLGVSPGLVPGQYAVMTGQARTDHGGTYAKGKAKGAQDAPSTFIALVTMGTGPECFKGEPKGSTSGLRWGVVQMEYAIIPGVDLVGALGEPAPLCKRSGPPVNPPEQFPGNPGHGCLYSEKP